MQAEKVKFLSKSEIKKIEEIIEKNYGEKLDFSGVDLVRTSGGKIFLLSSKIHEINVSKLRVSVAGLYFCRLIGEKIRLSIEGCQLVGKYAKKNFVVLNKDEVERFIKGYDVEIEKAVDCEENNFVLVRYGNDFFGTGKFSKGKVENLIPKSRRLF